MALTTKETFCCVCREHVGAWSKYAKGHDLGSGKVDRFACSLMGRASQHRFTKQLPFFSALCRASTMICLSTSLPLVKNPNAPTFFLEWHMVDYLSSASLFSFLRWQWQNHWGLQQGRGNKDQADLLPAHLAAQWAAAGLRPNAVIEDRRRHNSGWQWEKPDARHPVCAQRRGAACTNGASADAKRVHSTATRPPVRELLYWTR